MFEGIGLVFMEFHTEDIFIPAVPHGEIWEINFCRRGRVVCEFSDNTCAHLSEDDFWIGKGAYLPSSYYFPFKYYDAVSLVIDQRQMNPATRKLLGDFSIRLEAINENLALDTSWYIRKLPPRLRSLLDEIYELKGAAGAGYFAIKSLELLYQIQAFKQETAEMERYHTNAQIEAVKDIWSYLSAHLEEAVSLKELVKEKNIGTTLFQTIFYHIYGSSPYAFLKSYKMGIAKKMILDGGMKIGDIASALGYSNASKFSAAFKDAFGLLPKDYRKYKDT